VLPLDADHEDEGAVIPLAEWERADEFPAVIERAAELRAEDYRFEVVGPDAFNRFECPQCGATVEGKPVECPECGAPYKWP
jgi:rubrerythrin